MAVNYLDFDLLIERSETERYRARVLNSPAGQAAADFSLPFSELELENFLLRVGRTRRGVRRLESPEMEAARKFGGDLFEAVFTDQVRDCLRSSLVEVDRREVGLRIRLRLADTPGLAELPWEFLYDPALNRFLSLSVNTPLVRYLDLPEAIRPLGIKPPLRVLVMIASPRDCPALDVEREWAKLKEAVDDLERRGLVALEQLEGATMAALQHQLRQGAYHIFHFIGHGGFDQQAQDGVLMLEDEEGRGRTVSGQYLGALLHDERTLRLAILNACEGARTARGDPFAGTAQSLVQQGIPAVIAMQFEITDQAAITFAHEFYGALADGYPVDAALAEARKAIFAEGNDVEWGTPVLYLRAPDGRIFDVEKEEGAPPSPVVEKPVTYQESKPGEVAPAAPVTTRERGGTDRHSRLWLGIGAALVLLMAVAVLFLVTGPLGNGNKTPTVAPTEAPPVATSTHTPTPTDTPTPVPPGTPVAVALTKLEMWSGPGDDYEFLGYLPQGARRDIIGRDEAGEWWQIRTGGARDVAWIRAGTEFSEANDTEGVIVALAPPTPTGTPTLTPTPTSTPAMLICQIKADPKLSGRDQAKELGCPSSEAVKGAKSERKFAKQEFQKGWMFWRQDRKTIYVLYRDGTWHSFPDTWVGEQLGIDCPAPGPPLVTPDHGFGKVWRDELGGCREAIASIGWGTEQEDNVGAIVQEFDKGIMVMLDPDGSPKLHVLPYSSDSDHSSGQWK